MQMDWIFQLVFLAIVVVVVGLGIYFFSPLRGAKKEKHKPLPQDEHNGADIVLRQLKRYAATNEYKVIAPVAIEGTRHTADLDALLVGWFGILGVKCLGYGGTVYGQAKDEQWVQEVNGNRRTFENPLMRAQKSAQAIRDVLFAAKVKNIPVETIVVFTGKKTELALPRSTGHYTLDQFTSYLKSTRFEEDKKVEVEPVAALFEKK